MPSPFPGMDPYLEGYLWPDVHRALASEIRRRLVPVLRPRYVVRLEVYVIEDESPELEIGIMYPDVEILSATRRPGELPRAQEPSPDVSPTRPIKAPLTIPALNPVEVRHVNVEIRDAAGNELVSSIEILSPVNKREPGISRHRKKREKLHQQGVHILEIDLLRRGTRTLASHPKLPEARYLITLTRAGSSIIEVWPIQLSDHLPIVPIPLREPEPDVPLELTPVLNSIYDEAAYELSLDYAEAPPPPPLSPAEETWMKKLLGR